MASTEERHNAKEADKPDERRKEMDKFVLKRKKHVYSNRSSRYMTIRIHTADYNVLANWAAETGEPLVKVLGDCVKFAEDHAEWEEQK